VLRENRCPNLGDPGSESVRVLVVDEEVVCNTLAIIFQAHGFEVKCAYSAEEALELLSEWTPELDVLDVNLGKSMNGVELAYRMFVACAKGRL
jgi:DNA-binding response OmpR family regulator